MVIVALIVGTVWIFESATNKKKISYYELMYEMIPNGKVEAIYVDGFYAVRIKLSANSTTGNSFPTQNDGVIYIPNRDRFHDDFERVLDAQNALIAQQEANAGNETSDPENGGGIGEPMENQDGTLTVIPETGPGFVRVADIAVTFSNPASGNVGSIIINILLIGSMLFIAVYFIRSMGKQNAQGVMFAKSNARVNDKVKVRFTDVAGCDEEKEELKEVIEFLKAPQRFTEVGARIPHGILLVGPPGTGKTLLAKAVAGEAGVPFFSISGSDFVEMYVGVGAARVRDLFSQAKRNTPCIIFIDEIDAVGRRRGQGHGGGSDEKEQTLNQLLVELDGFETNSGVIVMAATNRSDILDPALMRPGRFDRQVYVDIPDVRGREAILRVHARNKPISNDVNFAVVAKMTVGCSGADLENILNEAAILAVRDNRKQICMDDINEAISKVSMGPAKKSKVMTPSDKRATAYHEAGHAILAKLLKNVPTVHEVTIIPRGRALGYTSIRPDGDKLDTTKAMLTDMIVMTLGGRVAEELILSSVTSGAAGDIRQVKARAHAMVTELGMSDAVGPMYFGSEPDYFGNTHVSCSEEMAALIDREEKKIVDNALMTARKLLSENIQLLHNFAKVLVECETIYEKHVNKLMEGASPEEVIDEIRQETEEFIRKHENLRKEQVAAEERAKREAELKGQSVSQENKPEK